MPEDFAPALPQLAPLDEDRLKQWLNRETISAQKLRTGEIQAVDITLGSGGTIESSNFVADTSGWQIDGDGNAEFNNVTVRGDLVMGDTNSISVLNSGGTEVASIEFNSSPAGLLIDGSTTFDDNVRVNGSLTIPDGSASTPSLGFILDGNTGIFSAGSNQMGLTAGGVEIARINGGSNPAILLKDGDDNNPSLSFLSDTDTGIYRPGSNEIGLAVGTVFGFGILNPQTVNSPFIRDLTTASAANVFIGASTGNMARSTSSLKYKPDWRLAPEAADYDLPLPIKWTDEKGQLRLGFGAEHIHKAVPEAYEEEIYDLRSLVAILSEKVKRLESRPRWWRRLLRAFGS